MTFTELYGRHAYAEPFDEEAFTKDVFTYLNNSGVPKCYQERVFDVAYDLSSEYGTHWAAMVMMADLVRIFQEEAGTPQDRGPSEVEETEGD